MPKSECQERHDKSWVKSAKCSFNESDIGYDSDDSSITVSGETEADAQTHLRWWKWRRNIIRERRSSAKK